MDEIENEDNALRRLYRAANLSAADVAAAMDVSPSTVSEWNSRRKVVRTDRILTLATLLGVDAETIILATIRKANGEGSSEEDREHEGERREGRGETDDPAGSPAR